MISNHLKAQVLNRMKEQNLATTELEKKAGLNRGTAANILHGRSKNPTLETLNSIATVLNCTINDLVEDPELSDKKNVAKTDKQYELLVDLFYKVLDYTIICLKNNKYDPSLDQLLLFIKESYVYSLTKNNKQVDKSFIEWLIDKNVDSY